ncbi:double-stranded DNA-binding domain-containing protein [Ochromonadaceae sp. CCMP2298]|nr:double-stranded DNA-binding domain-containing protein [Ochromonadaceae sp. CCMP2298]
MQQQQKAAYEERRVSILDQILEPDAKVRLQRLAIVKKEKVRAIEESLIAAATSGKLQSKVSEEQLIAMLEGADGPVATKKAAVVMQRRKYGFDEEEDDDDSDLM